METNWRYDMNEERLIHLLSFGSMNSIIEIKLVKFTSSRSPIRTRRTLWIKIHFDLKNWVSNTYVHIDSLFFN